MTTVGTACSDYTCNACNYQWQDTKQKGYEAAAYEYSGCPECKSKDCSWEPHIPDVQNYSSAPAILGTSNNLGKPPKDFVDGVLGRIKKHHSGYHGNKSSINTDW